MGRKTCIGYWLLLLLAFSGLGASRTDVAEIHRGKVFFGSDPKNISDTATTMAWLDSTRVANLFGTSFALCGSNLKIVETDTFWFRNCTLAVDTNLGLSYVFLDSLDDTSYVQIDTDTVIIHFKNDFLDSVKVGIIESDTFYIDRISADSVDMYVDTTDLTGTGCAELILIPSIVDSAIAGSCSLLIDTSYVLTIVSDTLFSYTQIDRDSAVLRVDTAMTRVGYDYPNDSNWVERIGRDTFSVHFMCSRPIFRTKDSTDFNMWIDSDSCIIWMVNDTDNVGGGSLDYDTIWSPIDSSSFSLIPISPNTLDLGNDLYIGSGISADVGYLPDTIGWEYYDSLRSGQVWYGPPIVIGGDTIVSGDTIPIDYVFAQGVGVRLVVILQPGIYSLDTTLTLKGSRLELRGAGGSGWTDVENIAVGSQAEGLVVLQMGPEWASFPMINIENTHVMLTSLTIRNTMPIGSDTTYDTDGYLLDIRGNASHFIARDCDFSTRFNVPRPRGLINIKGREVVLENCRITGGGGAGKAIAIGDSVFGQTGKITYSMPQDIFVRDCIIGSVNLYPEYGIFVQAHYWQPTRLHVRNTSIYSNKAAYFINGLTESQFDNNTLHSIQSPTVFVGADTMNVTCNTTSDNLTFSNEIWECDDSTTTSVIEMYRSPNRACKFIDVNCSPSSPSIIGTAEIQDTIYNNMYYGTIYETNDTIGVIPLGDWFVDAVASGNYIINPNYSIAPEVRDPLFGNYLSGYYINRGGGYYFTNYRFVSHFTIPNNFKDYGTGTEFLVMGYYNNELERDEFFGGIAVGDRVARQSSIIRPDAGNEGTVIPMTLAFEFEQRPAGLEQGYIWCMVSAPTAVTGGRPTVWLPKGIRYVKCR